jgi:ABC-type glycerol-3-phosphate transport system permease component
MRDRRTVRVVALMGAIVAWFQYWHALLVLTNRSKYMEEIGQMQVSRN